MKIKHLYIAILGICSTFTSCQNLNNVEDIEYVSINITAESAFDGITSIEGLKLTVENIAEGIKIERTLLEGDNLIDSLTPGIYNINIVGAKEFEDKPVYLSANKVNYLLKEPKENIHFRVVGFGAGGLLFSQIYYAGSRTPTNTSYFRDQFYEITNNTDETIYLDGIYFANLAPGSTTTTPATWPAEDGNNFVYAERVWQFPTNETGTRFPLGPGESFSIAQFAANHKLPIYNANAPIDCSTSEFEFNMDNANFPDQPAEDMKHIFYDGNASKGTLPQYLTSVFGGAFVIFKPLPGEAYDPVNNPDLKTRNLGTTSATLYAKIPLTYIIDGVETSATMNDVAGKRLPGIIDAGLTSVEATYTSTGVRRKLKQTRPNGSPILEDTNNSTEDFDRKVAPVFRYYGQGIPSWSRAN